MRDPGGGRVIVAASDRADVTQAHVALFTLDTAAARLIPTGEAYGMCLWRRAKDGALFGFVVMKDGQIDRISIDRAGAAPRVSTVRSMKLAPQAESCVVADRTHAR